MPRLQMQQVLIIAKRRAHRRELFAAADCGNPVEFQRRVINPRGRPNAPPGTAGIARLALSGLQIRGRRSGRTTRDTAQPVDASKQIMTPRGTRGIQAV